MQHSIAIVDDHILIAKAIAGIIDAFPSYKVLYEAEHGKALVEKLRIPKNIPDVVLLDITMPVMDGFETARWLKENHPEVFVLALSMQDDEQSLIRMIKSGARGYLLKNAHPTELEKALDTLITNKYYYPDWATNKIFLSIAESRDNTEISFTEREIEFFKYCCTEFTYREIAEKMFCSNRTVEGYRDTLFEKLGLKTRVGLVLYAIKNNIVIL